MEINSIFYDFSPTGPITSSSINYEVFNVPRPPNGPVLLVADSWFHKTTFIEFLVQRNKSDILFSFGAHENEVPGRLLPLLTYGMKRGEYRQFWHCPTQTLFTFWLTGDGKLVKNCTNRFIPETLPQAAKGSQSTPVNLDTRPLQNSTAAELDSSEEALVNWLLSVPVSKLELLVTKLAENHAVPLPKAASPARLVASVLNVPEAAVAAIEEEKKSAKALNRCPICKKVNGGSMKVECSTCKGWFHFDCDSSLGAQDRDTLTQEEEDYYCPQCREELPSPSPLPTEDEKRSDYDHFKSLTVKELKAECLRQGTKPASGSKEKILQGLIRHRQLVDTLPSSSKFIKEVVKNPPGNARQAIENGGIVIEQHKALFNGTDRITVLLYKIPWIGILQKNPKGVVIFSLVRLLIVNAFGEEANSVPVDEPLPHTIRKFVGGIVDNWPMPGKPVRRLQPKRKSPNDQCSDHGIHSLASNVVTEQEDFPSKRVRQDPSAAEVQFAFSTAEEQLADSAAKEPKTQQKRVVEELFSGEPLLKRQAPAPSGTCLAPS